jgi:Fic family protein
VRPDDITSNAAGTLIAIAPPLTADELRAVAAGHGSSQVGADAFLPNPLPPELAYDAELTTLVGWAMMALGQLDTAVQDLPNPYLLVRPLLRREAVESSRIEGTIATLDDLVVFEETHQVADETPGDVREVSNYLKALEYGLQQPPDRRISVSLIRELHHFLLQGVRGERQEPGTVRTRQNVIGLPGNTIHTARYVPPPPSEVPGLLSDLETYVASASDIPPLVRIALVHYQFEAIHPFLDGNGRVGRLLIALLLRKWGVMTFPVVDLSAYVRQHRTTYLDGLLHVSLRGDWRGWLRFFLGALHHQARDAHRRGRRLLELRQSYRQRLRPFTRSERLDPLIDHIFEHSTITSRRASDLVDVTFPTAQTVISRLERLGILQEATGRRRDRVYRANEIIALLDDRLS